MFKTTAPAADSTRMSGATTAADSSRTTASQASCTYRPPAEAVLALEGDDGEAAEAGAVPEQHDEPDAGQQVAQQHRVHRLDVLERQGERVDVREAGEQRDGDGRPHGEAPAPAPQRQGDEGHVDGHVGERERQGGHHRDEQAQARRAAGDRAAGLQQVEAERGQQRSDEDGDDVLPPAVGDEHGGCPCRLVLSRRHTTRVTCDGRAPRSGGQCRADGSAPSRRSRSSSASRKHGQRRGGDPRPDLAETVVRCRMPVVTLGVMPGSTTRRTSTPSGVPRQPRVGQR